MSGSFYFPIFSGVLEPEHVEKIGTALWEFIWLISKTTKEVKEGDENIGIVLGGRPIKNVEIADDLGISLSKVERSISRLRKYGYIETKRTPYGNIFKVKNSKKFYKNTSKKKDKTNKTEPSNMTVLKGENPQMCHREPSNMVERTLKSEGNKEDIKDIKDIKTTRQKYDEDNTYLKMAKYFHEKVSVVANDAGISHLIKKSNMQTWADDMRKLIELDQVDKRLAKDVMDWVTQDSFWRTNVLSAKKLREKFMELAIKMNAEKKPVQPKQKPVYDPRDKEIEFQRWIAEGNDPDEFDWS